MAKEIAEKKRYHLVIPDELYTQVQEAAAAKGTTVVHLLRWFIKVGLIALKASDSDDGALVIREGKKERQILFS